VMMKTTQMVMNLATHLATPPPLSALPVPQLTTSLYLQLFAQKNQAQSLSCFTRFVLELPQSIYPTHLSYAASVSTKQRTSLDYQTCELLLSTICPAKRLTVDHSFILWEVRTAHNLHQRYLSLTYRFDSRYEYKICHFILCARSPVYKHFCVPSKRRMDSGTL
jgi:hypothetical protein